MYSDKYSAKPPFPYADGYYGIFPRGMEDRDVGGGSLHIEEDYIIYFKENTPEDIKQRFIKDYAKYYKEQRRKMFGNFFD